MKFDHYANVGFEQRLCGNDMRGGHNLMVMVVMVMVMVMLVMVGPAMKDAGKTM